MAPEEACSADMLVLIRWQGRRMAVPLSQLAAVDLDRINRQRHRRLALLGLAGLPFLTPKSNKSLKRLNRAHYGKAPAPITAYMDRC